MDESVRRLWFLGERRPLSDDPADSIERLRTDPFDTTRAIDSGLLGSETEVLAPSLGSDP